MARATLPPCLAAALALAACGEREPPIPAESAATATPDIAAVTDAPPPPMPGDLPLVGGATMDPGRDILDNLGRSAEHTTLVAAIRAAGLDATLQGEGPFTVFAPTDTAFGMLPAGTRDALLEPANSERLTAILAYHVVPGSLDSATLAKQIEASGGTLALDSMGGGLLELGLDRNGALTVTDAQGRTARATTEDAIQRNGMVHVVDAVLLP